MKKFLKFSVVAVLIALGLTLSLGWPFWLFLILLGVAYGLYLLKPTNPKTAFAIGMMVVLVLIGSWVWPLFKGNFPVSNEGLPWAKNNFDVSLTKLMDPGLSKAKTVLVREIRTKEDNFAAEIPTLMQNNNYDEIKKRAQELINLRKDIEKLLAQTNPPLPPVAITTPAATPASGRTFTIALKPKEKYDVDKVRQGQRWSFPTFTGQFQSRVDTGDDSACWETVENTLPWKAEKSGTLQIRTGQADVKVTVNVQS